MTYLLGHVIVRGSIHVSRRPLENLAFNNRGALSVRGKVKLILGLPSIGVIK